MPKLSLVLFQYLFFLNIFGPKPEGKSQRTAEEPSRRVHKPFRVAREIGLAVDADLGLILIFG